MPNIIRPCPFCGSSNIEFSTKTIGDYKYDKGHSRTLSRRHVAMFCKDCNCYGKRAIVEATSRNGSNKEGLGIAIQNWNTRIEEKK